MSDPFIDDETRSVRAALSRYVGAPLPDDLRGTALANGIPDDGWVFPAASPDQVRPDAAGDLLAAGKRLRQDAEQAGLVMLVPGDAGWPGGTGADDLPCLWVYGNRDVAGLLRRAVTVVGARNCTTYGSHVVAEFAADLTAADCTVVTSAALSGIDERAARATSACGGRLIVVAGHGHLDALSAAVSRTLDAPGGRAALVLPFPPGTAPAPRRTAVAQRLLGTLTSATVVVETSRRGPVLACAGAGAATGRAVCAVPGPLTSAISAGCHDLIADGGARLVTSAADVLTTIQRHHGQPADEQPTDPPGERLFQVTATASWDDGRWHTRRVPVFHVAADTHHAAADIAYEIVFAASPYPSGDTLTAGLVDPSGVYEALTVSSTT